MDIYKCKECKKEFDKVQKNCTCCGGKLIKKSKLSFAVSESAIEVIGDIAEIIAEIVT